MGYEEYVSRMQQCVEQSRNDPERYHDEADCLITEFLIEKGYGELASLFEEVVKYYA